MELMQIPSANRALMYVNGISKNGIYANDIMKKYGI